MSIYRHGSGLLDHGPRLIDWAIKPFAYARAVILGGAAAQIAQKRRPVATIQKFFAGSLRPRRWRESGAGRSSALPRRRECAGRADTLARRISP